MDSIDRRDFTVFKNKNLYPLNVLIYIYQLFRLATSKKFDLVLLTGSEKADLLYVVIFSMIFWKKPLPHIIASAEWTPKKSWLKSFVQKLYFKLSNRMIAQIQIYSKEEIEIVHAKFGVPKEKLKAIPFSTTVIGYDLTPNHGNFLLTGGMSFRDYETFLEAVTKMDIPIEIGIPAASNILIKDVSNHPNIKIHSDLSRRDFMEKTSNCRIFAVPIKPGLERSVADQSILNAMFYGKIVIATDSIGPRTYIRNGINGFLVPESDPDAWVKTIQYVYSLDNAEYSKVAQNAEYTAKQIFNEEKKLLRVLDSACVYLSQNPSIVN
ncbi:MAG: glycosyltransferase [Leptospirales bacterium]